MFSVQASWVLTGILCCVSARTTPRALKNLRRSAWVSAMWSVQAKKWCRPVCCQSTHSGAGTADNVLSAIHIAVVMLPVCRILMTPCCNHSSNSVVRLSASIYSNHVWTLLRSGYYEPPESSTGALDKSVHYSSAVLTRPCSFGVGR